MSLRGDLIRLAKSNKDVRDAVLPMLRENAMKKSAGPGGDPDSFSQAYRQLSKKLGEAIFAELAINLSHLFDFPSKPEFSHNPATTTILVGSKSDPQGPDYLNVVVNPLGRGLNAKPSVEIGYHLNGKETPDEQIPMHKFSFTWELTSVSSLGQHIGKVLSNRVIKGS